MNRAAIFFFGHPYLESTTVLSDIESKTNFDRNTYIYPRLKRDNSLGDERQEVLCLQLGVLL